MSAEFVCPADHRHAEVSTCYILHKCRCDKCRAARTAASSQRNRLKAYGRYDTGLVDAEPARQHLLALRNFGLGYETVAKAAGLARHVTRTLLYGREDWQNGEHGPRHGEVKKRISRANADAILSVPFDLALLGSRITTDGRPTAWRLQALVALGWSQSKLAALIGMEVSNFGRVIRAKKVRPSTAIAVRKLYNELSNTAPPRDEWRDKIAYSRSVRYAAEQGWALPWDWEAYDNDFESRRTPVRRSA